MVAIAEHLRRDPDGMRRRAEAAKAFRHLHWFVYYAWHVIEPESELIWNWHIDVLCDHLEAVTDGRIQRLIINIPPGHMKSLLFNVFWPAWAWLRHPGWRWLFGTYSMDLSVRDSLKCRDLVTSDWYVDSFKPAWRLRRDDRRKTQYQNERGGVRLALTVGGKGTGFRGEVVAFDDPLNAILAESEAERSKVKHWWSKTMSQRGRLGRAKFVGAGQRLHEDDLFAHMIAQGKYDHICLPSEYDPELAATIRPTSIGFRDPRTRPGELLWPEVFTPEILADARAELGDDGYAAQHGQRPIPARGIMFDVEKFYVIDIAPVEGVRLRYWDKAATPGGGDYTAGVLMNMQANGLYVIEDVVFGQWGTVDREDMIRTVADMDGPDVMVFVEREGGSGGKDSEAITVMSLSDRTVEGDRVTGRLVERAGPFGSQLRAGNVRLVRNEKWNGRLIAEFAAFPKGRHDDIVAATVGAYNKLRLGPRPGRGAVRGRYLDRAFGRRGAA